MLNNQIIVTDDGLAACAHRRDQGVIDAALLPEPAWKQLRSENEALGGATKAKLIKCAKCWLEYDSEQWLSPKVNHRGTRVLAHQRGEGRPDHAYEPVETPEHRAYNKRAFIIGEAEGFNPRREAWAPDRSTRADVLLTGTVTIAYEHQHSPFSTTSRYSAPERSRLAAAVGRTAMWHATSDKVRGQVPILRTDGGLPPEVIENPNYRHEFRGGIYRIEIYMCTVRDGHECPNRKFSGCGKPHARGQVTAGQLDDVLRGAPVGAYMPVIDAKVIRAPKFFWTDQQSYGQYLAYIAGADPLSLLDGSPADQARTRSGVRQGHSRAKEAELEAMRAQAVILPRQAVGLAATEAPKRPVAPIIPRPAPGVCSHWIGAESRYCQLRDGVRRFVPGFRCPAHTPNALAGKPEIPSGPGWPVHRREGR